MTFLTIFLTGIGLSMDAFAVGIAKGMSLKRNHLKNSFIIGLYFGGFQALMPLIGWIGGKYFAKYIESFAPWIAFVLLAFIGGKMLLEAFKNDSEDEALEEAAVDTTSNELKHKDLLILAIATSIDALAVGISFAFLNVNIVMPIITIGLTTFVLSMIAVLIGNKLGEVFEKYSEILGGVILIGIGIKILLEYLLK